MSNFESVKVFMRTFGQEIKDKPGFPTTKITTGEVWKMLRECYKDEPFIRFIKDRKGIHQYPDPKMVIGSNYCDI